MENNRYSIFSTVRDALAAYPRKRLIPKLFNSGLGDHCAMGVLLPHADNETYRTLFLDTFGFGYTSRYDDEPISEIVNKNNCFEGTPEERYVHVLDWLNAEILIMESKLEHEQELMLV